jgi:arylsulfatase A-like enzyme
VNDARLPDDFTIDYGISQLEARHDKPFFLALGLHKPHMAWDVPKKYYDLFPLESIELPLTIENDLSDIPSAGVAMAKRHDDHRQVLASGRWKEAIQGYLAAIAYCDAQVGRLLDAFDRSPYASNTMIVFWGDHGWHLGEKEHWRKFTLWEEGTRTPLIWVVPGVTQPDSVCDRPVDLMSVYPTLCDLASLPIPDHVEGKSVKPLLLEPNAPWEQPAITTFHRNNHAVRTQRWRYIHYADGGEELYDHENDQYEWKNLANVPEMAATKQQLAALLPQRNVRELPRDRNSDE